MYDHRDQTEADPSIAFWTAGESGPKVLLVMGFGMRGDLWRPQVDDLRADHQVAWFDHRGLGASERGTKRFWSIRDMAVDAQGVMDRLGWDTAHLVGVSMGGMIAQEMALAAPERFTSVSLLVTHAGGPIRRKVPPFHGIKAFAAANLSRGRDRIEALRKLLYPDHYVANTDIVALRGRIARQLGRPVPRSTTLAQLYAVLRHDTRSRIGSLTMPMLIMKAGEDILVQPESADRLLERLPHADFVEFSDSGHGVIFQKADEVNDSLRAHFARAERR